MRDMNAELDQAHDVATIVHLDPSTIVKVYSGRPGCGCGCRGSYSTSPVSIKRIVANMKKRAHAPVLGRDIEGRTWTAPRIGVINDDAMGHDKIYFVEDAGRYYWAYTSPKRAR